VSFEAISNNSKLWNWGDVGLGMDWARFNVPPNALKVILRTGF